MSKCNHFYYRLLGIIQDFVDEVDLDQGNFSAVNHNLALFAFNISETNFAGLTLLTTAQPGTKLDDSKVLISVTIY